MIKTLVFHIGDPKNGSSSIQKAMQMGACQCDTLSIVAQEELNASALANSLIQKRSPQKYEREFGRKRQWAEANDADLGLVSAEFFSGAKPRALLRAMQENLPEHAATARIVAYVRPHASRLVSSYAQRVKTGTYTGYLNTFVNQGRKLPKFHYYGRFEKWHKVFGDRFTLRPFVREEMLNGDVVADFFNVALQGVPFTLAPMKNANESLTLEEIAAMRLVQSVLIEQQVPDFLRLSIGGAIGRELGQFPNRSDKKLRLNRPNAQKVADLYMDDAKRLDETFFEGAPMQRALTEAVEKAAPSFQFVATDKHYSAEEADRLRALASEMARLVNDMPQAWRKSYQAQIGQIPQDRADALSPERFRNAEAAWEALRGIVRIMLRAEADSAERQPELAGEQD